MAMFWYKRDASVSVLFYENEMNKLVLKGLLSSEFLSKNSKMYFGLLFTKFYSESSVSYYRTYCVKTGHASSVSRRFKLVSHQCKFYAASGSLVGLRKAQF